MENYDDLLAEFGYTDDVELAPLPYPNRSWVKCGEYYACTPPSWYEGTVNGRTAVYHRVVWCAHNWYTDVPEGHVVHHIDGNPANNHIDNLVLMTYQEHTQHHSGEPENVLKRRLRAEIAELKSQLKPPKPKPKPVAPPPKRLTPYAERLAKYKRAKQIRDRVVSARQGSCVSPS
jgi:HNH endonuclease